MSGKKQRRRFSDEFKAEVVRQVQTSGRPASEIARELGINVNLLYRWRSVVEAQTPREDVAIAEELGRLRQGERSFAS